MKITYEEVPNVNGLILGCHDGFFKVVYSDDPKHINAIIYWSYRNGWVLKAPNMPNWKFIDKNTITDFNIKVISIQHGKFTIEW